MSRELTKATRYIAQLDEARCNGDWNGVPELVRKTRKHAPQRSCLALAAETEHDITQITKTRTASSHGVASSSLSKFKQPILEAIENERTHPEDEFQAQTCLSWIYWSIGEYASAAGVFPGTIEQDFSRIDGTGRDSANWTRVCALKATYIKGASLEKLGLHAKAFDVYESAMPILSSIPQHTTGASELRTWTELFLTQFCMLSSYMIQSRPSDWQETESLSAFRAWASFWKGHSGSSMITGGYTTQATVSRRHVWKEYYSTLSSILRDDLPYPTTILSTSHTDHNTRLAQRAELQRVESGYESLMLKEISFPRADQSSAEVEGWVSLVMQNWHCLCNGGWGEEELGEGGSEAISRGVLDILYRAATKTFHSTSILRHLFTVHLAVADFDLAFKALDTYLEIVKKGKARVEKTGEVEEGLDDDETFLKTVSHGIRSLCRFGSYHEAKRAKELAQLAQEWLTKHCPEGSVHATGSGNVSGEEFEGARQGVPNETRAIVWGAIGISEANWARNTYDAAARSEIQLEAIRSLGKSLSREYGCSKHTDSLFALALVFAERRELSSALEVVKSALLPPSSSTSQEYTMKYTGTFGRERSLIPLWHLLAVLLSARQEFTTAAQACDGAFEQFLDPMNLFGAQNAGAYRSEHLNERHGEKPAAQARGIVDDMDDFEKEAVLEVKMTQLALIEIVEGPEEAVNVSDELLSLYARLFSDSPSQLADLAPKRVQTTLVPQTSAGSIRSLKGSIFGRKSTRHQIKPPVSGQITQLAGRPQSSQTVASTATRAPTIQVTNSNGDVSESQHRHRVLQKGAGSLTRRNRSDSAAQKSVNQVPTDISSSNTIQAPHLDHDDGYTDTARLSQIGLAITPANFEPNKGTSVLEPGVQTMQQKEPTLKPLVAAGQQDTRLPRSDARSSATSPATKFSKDEQRRRRSAILVRVWLMIAAFYRRAEMYEDARASIDEAEKLVQAAETAIEKDVSSGLTTDVAGWGQRKSVEELWGDVFSERGYLSVALSAPYGALACFEEALTHFGDHPSATVGLSNLLLDIFSEALPPTPLVPQLQLKGSTSTATSTTSLPRPQHASEQTLTPSASLITLQTVPLGLPCPAPNHTPHGRPPKLKHTVQSTLNPHSASSTAYLDRLACRDRAYGLLSGLTKLGSGWNYSEAWYALARAYEVGGQMDKARNALWWCVELEEGRGVRGWDVFGSGGYVL